MHCIEYRDVLHVIVFKGFTNVPLQRFLTMKSKYPSHMQKMCFRIWPSTWSLPCQDHCGNWNSVFHCPYSQPITSQGTSINRILNTGFKNSAKDVIDQ